MSQRNSSTDGLVTQMAGRLRDLRLRSGSPSVKRLEALTKMQGGARAMPRATIQDKLSGATRPRLEQVLALVAACARHAASIGVPLPEADVDENRWRDAWYALQQVSPERESATNDGGSQRQATSRSAEPEAATRRIQSLIDALANFHSNPEGIYYIGQTLIACEAFLDDHGIIDQEARVLINELSDELDNDERRNEGLFDPVISVGKVRKLIRRLREARRRLQE